MLARTLAWNKLASSAAPFFVRSDPHGIRSHETRLDDGVGAGLVFVILSVAGVPNACRFPVRWSGVAPRQQSLLEIAARFLAGARNRSAQFASRMLLREIHPRSRQDSRFSTPPAKSLRICTYKIAALTPLESALVKKERGHWPARAGIILNFRLSTANYQLNTTPLEYALTQKGGGVCAQKSTGRMSFCASTKSPRISTLTLDSRSLRMRNLGAQVGRPSARRAPQEPVWQTLPLEPVRRALL